MSEVRTSVQGQRLRRAAEAAFRRWPSFTCSSLAVDHARGGSVRWSDGTVEISIDVDFLEREFGVFLTAEDVTVSVEKIVPHAAKRLIRLPRSATAGALQARIEAVLELLAADAPELLAGGPAAERRLRLAADS